MKEAEMELESRLRSWRVLEAMKKSLGFTLVVMEKPIENFK